MLRRLYQIHEDMAAPVALAVLADMQFWLSISDFSSEWVERLR